MKKDKLILWAALGLLFSPKVTLALTCSPVKEMNKSTKGCNDNYIYTDAAYACADKFYLELEKKEGEILTKLTEANEKSQEKGLQQSKELDTAKLGYGYSATELANLIKSGKQSLANLKNYLFYIHYPEDFDAPEEVIGDPVKYLLNSKCYSENVDEIESLIEDLENDIKDLSAVRDAALGKKSGSAKRGVKLKGENGVLVPTESKAVGQGAPTKKIDPKKAQIPGDITGTEDIEQKRKEAEKIIRQEAPKK